MAARKRLLSLALLALCAPGAASADVSVQNGSVSADAPMAVMVSREDGAVIVRATNGDDVSASGRCTAGADAHTARCENLSELRVQGTDGADRIELGADLPGPTVRAGGGDDVVRTATVGAWQFFQGEAGDDTLDLSISGVGMTFWTDAFERVVGTDHADELHVRSSYGPRMGTVKTVDAGGGDDLVDLEDGFANEARCGGQPGDRVLAEHMDEAEGCGTVQKVGVPPPYVPGPRPEVPSYVPAQWRALGLKGNPVRLGDAILLEFAAPRGTRIDVTATAGAWRGEGAPVPLPPVSAGPADGRVALPVTIPLPAAALQTLADDARLRVRLEARSTDDLGAQATRAGAFTVVQLPTWRGALGGRRMIGSFGVQRFVGSPLGDLLDGRSADDRLLGMGGTDHLIGGTGNDELAGGAGDDLSDGLDGDDRHLGGPGNDHLVETRFGDDSLDGGDGDDILLGMRGSDAMLGGPGDDILDGGSGSDAMDCGPGEDIAFVNNVSERKKLRGCEEVHDGAGVDARSCDQGGTAGPETVLGTEDNDVCRGGGGTDDVEGRGGDDQLDGGDGADRIFGRFGDDELRGGAGDDELEGGRGLDVLEGGAGADALNGGHDPDVVEGGAGADRVVARGGGRDRIDCGAGRDVAIVDSSDVVRNCERVSRSGQRRARRRG